MVKVFGVFRVLKQIAHAHTDAQDEAGSAITAMVAFLVGVFAFLYVYQMVRTRISDAYVDTDFVSHEIFNAARGALEVDFSSTRVDTQNPAELREAIEETFARDPG